MKKFRFIRDGAVLGDKKHRVGVKALSNLYKITHLCDLFADKLLEGSLQMSASVAT